MNNAGWVALPFSTPIRQSLHWKTFLNPVRSEPTIEGDINKEFTWSEIRQPPSIGSQTRAMFSPDDLQRGHLLSDRGQLLAIGKISVIKIESTSIQEPIL
jgi:hypothetical protein